jgi:hypothetical protein
MLKSFSSAGIEHDEQVLAERGERRNGSACLKQRDGEGQRTSEPQEKRHERQSDSGSRAGEALHRAHNKESMSNAESDMRSVSKHAFPF